MKPEEIEGWMRDSELKWLARMAARCELIVEIGTWFGKSTCAMAQTVKGTIVTIDSFVSKGVPLRFDLAKVAHEEMKSDPDWIYKKCLENLSEFIENGKVQVIRADSNEAIKQLGHIVGEVDMVFIDGSHDYASVQKDIVNYRGLLKKGGLLSGHDYAYQVRKAVRELIPNHRIAKRTSIWTHIEE